MASINVNIAFAMETTNVGFRYKDTTMPIKLKPNLHDIEDLRDVSAIKNGINNIFTWNKGQRILNPEFGNPLSQYVGELVNDITSANIKSSIKNAINKWEPRVVVNDVSVTNNPDKNEITIGVIYSIPSLSVVDARLETSMKSFGAKV